LERACSIRSMFSDFWRTLSSMILLSSESLTRESRIFFGSQQKRHIVRAETLEVSGAVGLGKGGHAGILDAHHY
jgi:hypothetical protein